jgi:hypothetical protein
MSKFKFFDKDGNGVLNGPELLELADWFFIMFNPEGEMT